MQRIWGDREELAIRALTPGDGQMLPAPLLLGENHPTKESRELLRAQVLGKNTDIGKNATRVKCLGGGRAGGCSLSKAWAILPLSPTYSHPSETLLEVWADLVPRT